MKRGMNLALVSLLCGICLAGCSGNGIAKNQTGIAGKSGEESSMAGTTGNTYSSAASGRAGSSATALIKPSGPQNPVSCAVSSRKTTSESSKANSRASSKAGADAAARTIIFRSVDTMKESMDQIDPDRLTPAQKEDTCSLIASMHTTHITIDTMYDYPDVMKAWIDAVRSTGKNVWFRCHWAGWEGNYGVPANITSSEYISMTVNFIRAHPTFFKPGDILDACPEPENGKYWAAAYGNSWVNGSPNKATDDYNAFFVSLSRECSNALSKAGVKGVITNIRSTSGWWAFSPSALYDSSVQAMGCVTTDSYVGQDTSITPEASLDLFQTELNRIHEVRNLPVVIGEFGWSIDGNTTDEKQESILKPWFSWLEKLNWIDGINYWCGPGYATSGSGNDGTTDKIFSGTTGNWHLRPAAYDLSNLYAELEKIKP